VGNRQVRSEALDAIVTVFAEEQRVSHLARPRILRCYIAALKWIWGQWVNNRSERE